MDTPAVWIHRLVDDHYPGSRAGFSGLKPYAGWRLAAFCPEEVDGSSRTREFTDSASRALARTPSAWRWTPSLDTQGVALDTQGVGLDTQGVALG
jgi:hypothetical protein